MDARSIAATAANGGVITAATDLAYTDEHKPYEFDARIYDRRVFYGYGHANPDEELRYGPNIKDWPEMFAMKDNQLLELAAVIHDPVTTTDELIPSGETSSYRSNPLKLSEFALSRRVPEYVGHSKRIHRDDLDCRAGKCPEPIQKVLNRLVPQRKTLRSALAYLPTVRATVLLANRLPAVRRCWAVMLTFATNTPPSDTAATASTGALCLTRLMPKLRSTTNRATMYLFPAFVGYARWQGGNRRQGHFISRYHRHQVALCQSHAGRARNPCRRLPDELLPQGFTEINRNQRFLNLRIKT